MSTTSGGRENEMEKAQKAKPQQEESIFTQIIARKIPATILFEDERVIAFRDTYPQAPVHFLVVPKKPIPSIADAQDEDESTLGALLLTAGKVAVQEKLENGYRVVINNGPAGCQSVYHLHVHVLGGRQMNWPPG